MALVLEHHVHRTTAKNWWQTTEGIIGLTRFSEVSLLRLLTTAAAMDGKPLSVDQAWRVRDRLFDDDRVAWLSEPVGVDVQFRKYASGKSAAPKQWADAWLLAVASAAGGTLVTFDRALSARGAHCLLEAR